MSQRFTTRYELTTGSPVGMFRGQPVYVPFGCAPTGEDASNTGDGGSSDGADTETDDDSDDGDEGLTPGGKALIERERATARRARDALKPYRTLARETGLTVEQMREKLIGGSTAPAGTEKVETVDVEKIAREARAEERTRADRVIVRSEVTALAAGVLADPKDAARFLDLSDIEVDDDGDLVDPSAVTKAIKDLIKQKPYLAARGSSAPDFDGGPRVTTDKPTDTLSSAVRALRASNRR